MRPERRHIRLTFVESGIAVVAEMLDDEAPATCAWIWDALPMEHDVYHGRYSGMESFVVLDEAPQLPQERLCTMPLPGEILYWRDEGRAVTSSGQPVAEIVWAFGRGVRLGGPEGVPSFASLFARIPGDWKYDWNDFAAECGRVRTEGLKRIRIERVD